jgi:hypothetical protein
MNNRIGRLLAKVQHGKSESRMLDAKEHLHLDTDGDKANFIRHVVALANTGNKGYFLIGIENKTWKVKGIREGSSLLDADGTQQRMNQILNSRVDPPISIIYEIHEKDGLPIGSMTVEGKSPPYIIHLNHPKFGGPKTRGNRAYIYNGVIYRRQGANSVPANRQSEITEIINGAKDFLGLSLNLLFVALVVGAGVGLGVSLISFDSAKTAAIIGGMLGVFIGYLLNKRLAERIAPFFKQRLLQRVAVNLTGPLWGMIVAASLSYWFVYQKLWGDFQVTNPITMALVVAPTIIIISALFGIVEVIILNTIINTLFEGIFRILFRSEV